MGNPATVVPIKRMGSSYACTVPPSGVALALTLTVGSAEGPVDGAAVDVDRGIIATGEGDTFGAV